MPIPVSCPHCDWKGRVRDGLSGGKGKCPTCGELVDVPKASAVKADPPRPAPKPVAVADDDEEKPKPKAKRSLDDVLSSARGRDVDEDDDRPAKSRRRPADEDDDEDDRPAKSRRRPADEDDEDDDRPAKSRRRPADEDDDDDRPRPKAARRDYDDEDDEDDDRPRQKKKRRRPGDYGDEEGTSGKKVGMIVVGVIFLLIGLGLFGLNILIGGRVYWSIAPIVFGVITIIQAMQQKK